LGGVDYGLDSFRDKRREERELLLVCKAGVIRKISPISSLQLKELVGITVLNLLALGLGGEVGVDPMRRLPTGVDRETLRQGPWVEEIVGPRRDAH